MCGAASALERRFGLLVHPQVLFDGAGQLGLLDAERDLLALAHPVGRAILSPKLSSPVRLEGHYATEFGVCTLFVPIGKSICKNPREARTKKAREARTAKPPPILAHEGYFLTSGQTNSASLPKASSPFIVFKIL